MAIQNNSNNGGLNGCQKAQIFIETLLVLTFLVIGILAQVRPDLVSQTTVSNLLITLSLMTLLNIIASFCASRKPVLDTSRDEALARQLQGQPEEPMPAQNNIHSLHDQQSRPFRAFTGTGNKLGGT